MPDAAIPHVGGLELPASYYYVVSIACHSMGPMST